LIGHSPRRCCGAGLRVIRSRDVSDEIKLKGGP
jgi:hypothetical protein